jgi:hypothetical protein
LSTQILGQVKAQLKQLQEDRKDHEKAVREIRAREVKIQKALSAVAATVPAQPKQ